MSYYLKSVKLTRDMLGNETRKLKYLKSLIGDKNELNKSIAKKYSISTFGNENEDLNIKGVKALINGFDEIDTEKMDIMVQYKDVEFKEINEKNQIVLSFANEDIVAHSIYDFYTGFLNEFEVTKFINYCLKNGYIDIIQQNIKWLLLRNGNKEKRFRLLKDHDDTWGMRGLTSKNYKKYDNSVVLYLSLLALHKYSKDKQKAYHVDTAFISDSSLNLFFEKDDPIELPEVGKIYLGLTVSNGEIRNKTFKAELRYKIVDFKDNSSFYAIFHSPVFNIVHSMNIETIDSHLENLFKLDEQEESLIEFIKKIKVTEKLSDDVLYFITRELLEKINECSDISKKTKDEFKKVETERLINNTYNLINYFDRLSKISTDIDEKIFIERIYHKVIVDLLNQK